MGCIRICLSVSSTSIQISKTKNFSSSAAVRIVLQLTFKYLQISIIDRKLLVQYLQVQLESYTRKLLTSIQRNSRSEGKVQNLLSKRYLLSIEKTPQLSLSSFIVQLEDPCELIWAQTYLIEKDV